MDVAFRILADPDPCSLGLLIVVLCFVGSMLLADREYLQAVGYWFASVCFLLYGVIVAAIEEPRSAEAFVYLTFRSLAAGAWAFGCVSIVLGIGTNTVMVWRKLRTFMFGLRPRRFPEPPPMHWPDPPRLPAPLPVEVIDVNSEPAKVESVKERVLRERQEYEQRLETVSEMQSAAGLDDEMVQELAAKELERYLRRVNDVLGYR